MVEDEQRDTSFDVFRYRALEKGSIRLVRILPDSTPGDIRCSLEHHDTSISRSNEQQAYTALSYCWGNPSSKQAITLNGSPFPITSNLCEALNAICQYHDHTQPFWIDAICINQADVTERNEQVSRMQHIFAQASRTYAWLGPELDHTRLAFKVLRQMHRECVESDYRDGPDSNSLVRYGAVCGRPASGHHISTPRAAFAALSLSFSNYFRRVWIRPEYIRSRIGRLQILCGSHMLDDITFNHTLPKITTPTGLRIREDVDRLIYERSAHRITFTGWPESSPPYKFRETLKLFSRCDCTDPRDRIFAMLSDEGIQTVCTPADHLGPDYRWSVDELILIVIAFYDRLLLSPDYDPSLNTPKHRITLTQGTIYGELARLLPLLHDALGAPATLPDLRTWFDAHESWLRDFSTTGSVSIKASPRKVDCSGPCLHLILEERDYAGDEKELFPKNIYVRPFQDERGTWLGTVTGIVD